MTETQDKGDTALKGFTQDTDKRNNGDGLKLAFYLRYNRIYIAKKTMEALGMPDYVHLLINEKEKWLFINSCKKDKDAFNVYFTCGEDSKSMHYMITEKPLLKWLAQIIGMEGRTETVQFSGVYIPEDEAVFFDMKRYNVISNSGSTGL